MALAKSRQCSESCLEFLAIELVHHYARQTRVPAPVALDAIGMSVDCIVHFLESCSSLEVKAGGGGSRQLDNAVLLTTLCCPNSSAGACNIVSWSCAAETADLHGLIVQYIEPSLVARPGVA